MCYWLLSIDEVIQYLKLDFNRQCRKRHYSITVLEKLLGGKAKCPYVIILIYCSWVALRLKQSFILMSLIFHRLGDGRLSKGTPRNSKVDKCLPHSLSI